MGTSHSQQSGDNTAFAVQYKINLIRADGRHGGIQQHAGQFAGSFPDHAKTQVLNDFSECLKASDEEWFPMYQKYVRIARGLLALWCLGLFGVVFLFAKSTTSSSTNWIIIAFWFCLLAIIAFVFSKQKGVTKKWRNSVLDRLRNKITIWQGAYPAFSFTVVYPVEEWKESMGDDTDSGDGRTKVAVWCILRITMGTLLHLYVPCCSKSPRTFFARFEKGFYEKKCTGTF